MSDIIFSPTKCVIDLEAIKNNFRALGSPAAMMPVIKSDAYGHGLLPVARTLDSLGATRFAVGSVQEGIALRKVGLSQEIVLLMGCHDGEEWRLAREYRLLPLLGSFEDFERMDGSPQDVCIKCDTGMSRLGFTLDEAALLLDKLGQNAQIRPKMVLSHFACADMPEANDITHAQTEIFNSFHGLFQEAFPGISPSLGNSAATLEQDRNENEIFRPGLILYGGNPFYGTDKADLGARLKWAMELASPIIQIRNLKAGDHVSYGCTYTAPKEMRIAIVACGYSQGYSRALSGRVSALVKGRRVRQIGRICMGMCMLDISSLENVKTGDLAWLVGGEALEGEKGVTMQELADLLNTIPYEPMCIFGAMNPRVYK